MNRSDRYPALKGALALKLSFLAIGFLCMSGRLFAQADVHFSQFYEASILRNPALTGMFSEDYKVGVYYRKQWASISNPFETKLLSAEGRVAISQNSEDFFSFGVLTYYDKAGSVDQSITTVYPAVNYNKSINPDYNTFLSVGFTGGYMQYAFEPSKATFNNQYLNGQYNKNNPTYENFPNAKMTMWDLGAGVTYSTSTGANNRVTWMIGAAGYHFTQPRFSYFPGIDLKQNIRWNGNGAVSINFTDDILVQLHANYARQGTYQEIMAGGLVNWIRTRTGMQEATFTLCGGVFMRYNDALIPVLKVKFKDIAVGVSYDVNTSSLKRASNQEGGFEVTIFKTGNFSDKGISRKTVCPKF